MIYTIIQARMGSTRLPGKIMKDIAGKPQLWHVVNRVRACKQVDQVILATTDQPQDDQVYQYCLEQNIPCFRGSEKDVLDRYYQAAVHGGVKAGDDVIRITADCPVIDPEVVGQLIELYQSSKVDYASNIEPPTYPDGLDAEIFSFHVLEKAWKESTTQLEREHVTVYMRDPKAGLARANLENKEDLSHLRWTVDEKEDLEVIRFIYDILYKEKPIFLLADMLEVLQQHPGLGDKNKQYERNEGMKQ